MEKNLRALFALITIAVISPEVSAYKETTHADITKRAVQQSELNTPVVLSGLGLGQSASERVLITLGPLGVATPTSPEELLKQGAREEDLGVRSLRHFFDPQRGGAGLPLFEASPTWALQSVSDDQLFAWDNAREYLLGALIGATEAQRSSAVSLLFLSIGHVVHHIQDMHQPQHVRGDHHCDDSPFFFGWWFASGCNSAAIGFLYRPSAYEQYVWEQGIAPTAGYPIPDYATFDSARAFWEQGGKGGAEFTSNNFVSAATNFRLDASTAPLLIRSEDQHALPRGSEAKLTSVSINDPELIRRVTSPAPMTGDISYVETPIRDEYLPSFNVPNARTSMLSIWYDSLQAGPIQVAQPVAGFTLNSVTYQAAMERLLPRAAAYSAGLINYFFRGRIEIGLPADGVYGVVDHATTYAAGQGFGKLKLKLRNASPDGVKPSGEHVPQTMEGGTLVAVAKYTLNSCYLPDLTGDFGAALDTGAVVYPANCTLDQYFAGEEQISQSAAILGATLTPTAEEFTFDFDSQPIPINARDLRIQVVYTGQLGAEAEGIAFGGRDISEPTHLVVYNNSDYYAVDGKLYTPSQIQSDPHLAQRTAGQVIDPRALRDVSFAFVPNRYVAGPSTQPVEANGYLRVAVLADVDSTINVTVRLRFDGGSAFSSTFSGVVPAVTDLRGETAYITPFGIWRGMRVHMVDVVYRANNAVTLADGELTAMSAHAEPDPGPTPIPVEF